jgi:RNA polymerase sigma factor for flagellar operon FliA
MSLKLKRTQIPYSTVTTSPVTAGGFSLADRNALVEAHLPQVKFIAERMAAKLPPSVDRDDLIGAGVLGLLDAVDKFDPARGVQFKTYAEMRVRGAMLDSLRLLDWAPRSMRHRAREIEAAYHRIEQERGRAAEEGEVAEALGLSVLEFQTLLGELRGLTLLGLEGDDDDDEFPVPQIPDDPERGPLALYERTESRDRLIGAIDRLPERERQVVALYYLEELTMKEIGSVLGVTESRVSQLHTQAILRLRAGLNRKTKEQHQDQKSPAGLKAGKQPVHRSSR